MMYACEHYSTAMLEKLAHGSGSLPPLERALLMPGRLTTAANQVWDFVGGLRQVRSRSVHGVMGTWYRSYRYS
ncbi:MAG TPA: hypothetical protein VJ787_06055 [Thermoleophilia bacterium]|nr:hypothetical protein [Thermoleophilia bacterium]